MKINKKNNKIKYLLLSAVGIFGALSSSIPLIINQSSNVVVNKNINNDSSLIQNNALLMNNYSNSDSAKTINFNSSNTMINYTYNNNDVINYLGIRSIGENYPHDWIVNRNSNKYNILFKSEGENVKVYLNNNYYLAKSNFVPEKAIGFSFTSNNNQQNYDLNKGFTILDGNGVKWSDYAIQKFNGLDITDGVLVIRNSTDKKITSTPWLQTVMENLNNGLMNTIAANNFSHANDLFNGWFYDQGKINYLKEYDDINNYRKCLIRFGTFDGMFWKGIDGSKITKFAYNANAVKKYSKNAFISILNSENLSQFFELEMYNTPKAVLGKNIDNASIIVNDNVDRKCVTVTVKTNKTYVPNLNLASNPNDLDNNWIKDTPMSMSIDIPYSIFSDLEEYSITLKSDEISLDKSDVSVKDLINDPNEIKKLIIENSNKIFNGAPSWFDWNSNLYIDTISNDVIESNLGKVTIDFHINNANTNLNVYSGKVVLTGFKIQNTVDNFTNATDITFDLVNGNFASGWLSKYPTNMINELLVKNYLWEKRNLLYDNLPNDFSINDINVIVNGANAKDGSLNITYSINKYLDQNMEVIVDKFGEHQAIITTSVKVAPTKVYLNEDEINKNMLPSKVDTFIFNQLLSINEQNFNIWNANQPIYANDVSEVIQIFSNFNLLDENDNKVNIADVIYQEATNIDNFYQNAYYTNKNLKVSLVSLSDLSYNVTNISDKDGSLQLDLTINNYYDEDGSLIKNYKTNIIVEGFDKFYQIETTLDNIVNGIMYFEYGNKEQLASDISAENIKSSVIAHKFAFFKNLPDGFDLASNITISNLEKLNNDGYLSFDLILSNANSYGQQIVKKVIFYGYKLPVTFNTTYVSFDEENNLATFNLKSELLSSSNLNGLDLVAQKGSKEEKISTLKKLLENDWKNYIFVDAPSKINVSFDEEATVFDQVNGSVNIKGLKFSMQPLLLIANNSTRIVKETTEEISFGDIDITGFNLKVSQSKPLHKRTWFIWLMISIGILIAIILIALIIAAIIRRRRIANNEYYWYYKNY